MILLCHQPYQTALHRIQCRGLKLYVVKLTMLVLFGCDVWSFAVGEESEVRICENKVLKNNILVIEERM